MKYVRIETTFWKSQGQIHAFVKYQVGFWRTPISTTTSL